MANRFTKSNEHKELQPFYRMHHRWRIVEDEKASARRRKTMGLSPLEDKSKRVESEHEGENLDYVEIFEGT